MHDVRIGICEDDAVLRSILTQALKDERFTVDATATGHEAVLRFSEHPPGAMILDIGLPDADGRDVCQALRAHGVDAPVIFLTARDALTDRLAGFSSGGDDYLTKPFEIAELIARVNALLRRAAASKPSEPQTSERVKLDPSGHRLRVADRSVKLTPTEFRIFAALAARPSAVIRRVELINTAWPAGSIVHENTLDAYIARLRRKLRQINAPETIETLRGIGYQLQ